MAGYADGSACSCGSNGNGPHAGTLSNAVGSARAEGLDGCHEWSWALVEQWRLPHECGADQEGVQRSVSSKLVGYDDPV
jgi:hypothetical protein